MAERKRIKGRGTPGITIAIDGHREKEPHTVEVDHLEGTEAHLVKLIQVVAALAKQSLPADKTDGVLSACDKLVMSIAKQDAPKAATKSKPKRIKAENGN